MTHADEEEEESELRCEECLEILSVPFCSEPTRFCTDCAHEIAERLTDAEAARTSAAWMRDRFGS